MSKIETIRVQGFPINVEEDYICLTDMVKSQGDEKRPANEINNWLNTKSTIDFLGTWEAINNQKLFKVLEFQDFRNNYTKQTSISVSQWVNLTGAVGIFSRLGKTGGVYAHKDIAFEFGSWLSPIFKLYLIKEFQRLKEIESNINNIEWNVRRVLSKAQYHVQTDAIKAYKIPFLPPHKHGFAYAEEGDILNIALFGFTAKQWREANPDLAAKGQNAREYASINELVIMSTLEGMNAELMKQGVSFPKRLEMLKEIVSTQMATLDRINPQNSLRKDKHGNLIAPGFKKEMFPINSPLSDHNQKLMQALNYNPKEDKQK